MKIDIDHIAKLSQLEFTKSEKEKIYKDISNIVAMIGSLPEISENVQNDKIMELRSDDISENEFIREEMFLNAPSEFNGFIAVPKTIL